MPKSYVKKISSLLIANRGEIAIRIMRAASELGIRTVAVYTFEDRYSLHRYKADEAYQIGKDDEPLKPYLDIEGLISLCKSSLVLCKSFSNFSRPELMCSLTPLIASCNSVLSAFFLSSSLSMLIRIKIWFVSRVLSCLLPELRPARLFFKL